MSFKNQFCNWTTRTTLMLSACSLTLLSACSQVPEPGELGGLAGSAISFERWQAGLTRKTIDVNGEQIAYLDGGKGEPLILVHGFGANKDNFDRVAKQLTPYMRVIALDLPGFGASSKKEDADYSVPAQVKRVHEFANALGLKNIHIGGNSMGGWISGLYTASYPNEVESVWFLAPAGMAASRKSEVFTEFAKTGKVMLTASNRQEYEQIIDLVMFKRPALLPGFVLDAMAQKAAENQALHNKIYSIIRSDTREMDQIIAQAGYKNPALIVWGENDRVLHVDGAQSLAAALPQAKTIIMKNMGHVPMMERPDEVAESYLQFRGFKKP